MRLGFARVFLHALDAVQAYPSEVSSWVQLLIQPWCVLHMRKLCQFDSISRAISRWRDPDDRLSLVLDRLAELPPPSTSASKIIAAIKVLSSSGVAPFFLDTLQTLEAKHPFTPLQSHLLSPAIRTHLP